MLDNHRHGISRFLDRRVADKQCVVTLLPGAFDVLRDPGLTLFFGDSLDLHSPGLAGHATL